VTNDFNDNGYNLIKQVISKDKAKELTYLLKELVAKGLTRHDEQCPSSDAIYGHTTFDKLLEDLTPIVEQHTGKKLHPTYSYARLYKSGEELKIHRDRPSCEISMTLTLESSGKQWAIYMGDEEDKTNASKILMEVGDAVIYRGMDKYHWRESFEGEWQAQVFLHYVDANGLHAEWKYDKRKSLGLPSVETNIENYIDNTLTPVAVFKNHISDKLCDLLIDQCNTETVTKIPPIVGQDGNPRIDKSVRDVERILVPPNTGIGGTLTATALNANQFWWKYDVTHAIQTELLIYKPEGHYHAHIDTEHKHDHNTRKLTALAFLNDDFEGGKFFINATGNIMYPPQEKGTILVFPSYMVHGVEPVTQGIRYSAVSWLLGPYFK